jgi:hypothetical protein
MSPLEVHHALPPCLGQHRARVQHHGCRHGRHPGCHLGRCHCFALCCHCEPTHLRVWPVVVGDQMSWMMLHCKGGVMWHGKGEQSCPQAVLYEILGAENELAKIRTHACAQNTHEPRPARVGGIFGVNCSVLCVLCLFHCILSSHLANSCSLGSCLSSPAHAHKCHSRPCFHTLA